MRITKLEKPVMRKYPPTIVKCRQCGVPFPTHKGQHASKFCDEECRTSHTLAKLEANETKKFKSARLAREMDKKRRGK
jgi:hypothetical protein